jgi:hypothetical protein
MRTHRADVVEQVLIRDNFACVACKSKHELTAHHILERALWNDTAHQGYILDNLVTVCDNCHWLAEEGYLTPVALRDFAGIKRVVLPEHLYPDTEYDKWGNPIESGAILRGELSWERGMEMMEYTKYPRTYHLPWSNPSKGDRSMTVLPQVWYDEDIVVTDKIDGQNITMYHDYIHSRAVVGARIDSWTKNMWSKIAHNIPVGWRVCGDSVAITHTVDYERDFWMHSIWNGDTALSWDETKVWASLLDLTLVHELFRGSFEDFMKFELQIQATMDEGYVIRPVSAFKFKDYRHVVGKLVTAEFQQRRQEMMYG